MAESKPTKKREFFERSSVRVFIIPLAFLIITLTSGYWMTTKEIQKRADLRADQILAAFKAEVETLKPLFCEAAAHSYRLWEQSDWKVFVTAWNFPRPIFLANVGNLGELNDVETTKQLVRFYVGLDAGLDAAKRVRQGPPGGSKKLSFVNYLRETTNACSAAILLTAKLDVMSPESIALDKFLEQDGLAKIQGQDSRYRELMTQIRENLRDVQIRVDLDLNQEKEPD